METTNTKFNEKLIPLFLQFFMLTEVILVLVFVIVFRSNSSAVTKNICLSADCVNSSDFYQNIINNSVDPCDNFYEFACGGFDGPISILEISEKTVFDEFKSFIASPIHDDDQRAVKMQKKYYMNCINTSAIEEDDNASIKKIFEQLGGWPLLSLDLVIPINAKITEQCAEMGLFYDWFTELDTKEAFYPYSKQILHITPPGIRNLVEEDFKDNYQLLIENIVKRLGSKRGLDFISKAAKNVADFERSLAKIILESRNTTRVTIGELKTDFPSLPWDGILKNVDHNENTTVVANVWYFIRLIRLLEQSSNSVKVNYIFWKVTKSLYPFLSRDIRREFEAYEDVISVTKGHKKQSRKRADFCYGLTQTVFAYVSEGAYANKYSSERESIRQIVDNIKTVLHDHINRSKWMNHTHKTYALGKLRNVRAFIGAPDEVFDENEFEKILGVDEIDILRLNNTLDIVRAVDKSRDKYNLNLSKKKINYLQAKLYQGIVTIDARYIPEENLIYIPAAIIGGVLDSHKGLNFRNYSILGTIIAHELTHSMGILDNFMNGTKAPRWSNETYNRFLRQSKCLIDQCLQFNETGVTLETCYLTFDENFADYTSVDVSYEAFSKVKPELINQLPGLKYNLNQLFWISYASTMCDSDDNSTSLNRVHLEPPQRILGSYRNSMHFAKDFNCSLGTYMNPVDKCYVL
ncbi:neprilysin-2-like isoform X2 [Diabrotica undecimpunctata]|uniref:neprilysin-2-like isoform X2 n=1 Tax=Diabrotica undecimpunctata TaxID=50387 RepID=UPI003B633C13